MLSVNVRSRISGTKGAEKKIEIDEEDSIEDLLRRVCLVFGVDVDQNIRIRLEDKRIAANDEKLGRTVRNECLVFLETRKVNKGRWAMAALSFLFGAALIVVGCVLNSMEDVEPAHEGNAVGKAVVLDAGSSHTGTFLFDLTWTKAYVTAFAAELNECSIEGGIADLKDVSVTALQTYLEPCLTETYEKIGSSGANATPIALGATAGMRMLELEDPVKANTIIENLKIVLGNSGFLFNDSDVEILDGAEEGAFAWISTNMATDALTSSDTSTTGSMDMGGASSQYTFEDSANANLHYVIYNETYDIFSDSLICYGIRETLNRFAADLVYKSYANGSVSTALLNPCMNLYFETNKRKNFDRPLSRSHPRSTWLPSFPSTKGEIFSSVCTEINDTNFTKFLDTLPENFTFVHEAAYDFGDCDDSLEIFLNEADCRDVFVSGDCMNPAAYPQEPAADAFFAMSSFYWDFAKSIGWTAGLSLIEADALVEAICVEDQTCDECSETDCFMARVIFKELIDGYHFDTDQEFLKLDFVDEVEGQSVAWPLGYVIDWSGQADFPRPAPSMIGKTTSSFIPPAVFGILVGFGSVFCLSGLIAAVFFARGRI